MLNTEYGPFVILRLVGESLLHWLVFDSYIDA